MQQHTFQLQNGLRVPALIFGTYKTAEEQNEDVLLTAIEAGYRAFDTASFYGTESYLGSAIRKSGLAREEVFITSKLWKTEMGYEGAMAAAMVTPPPACLGRMIVPPAASTAARSQTLSTPVTLRTKAEGVNCPGAFCSCAAE